MPRKSFKPTHTEITKAGETEVLDAYAELIESSESPDLLLQHFPALMDHMQIPRCFTKDITSCIAWFYDTRRMGPVEPSPRWTVTQSLLRHLTLSVLGNDPPEISDIIDVDKLLKFMGRLISMRDNYEYILESWALFVEASQGAQKDYTQCTLSLQDLQKIKSILALDDLGDSLLIDMIGCGTGLANGEIFNYSFGSSEVHVTLKDFADILGRAGEF